MDILRNADFWNAIIVVAIVLFGVYALKSYLKRLAEGCCAGGGDSEKIKRIKVSDRNPNHYPYKAVLTIDGMVCGNCAARVENALNGMESVWATVDLMRKQAVVRMKREIDDKNLRSAVNGLGLYTVIKIDRTSKEENVC
jgi:copper chaperone CopZ